MKVLGMTDSRPKVVVGILLVLGALVGFQTARAVHSGTTTAA
jgi:hypothetical protein